MKLQLYSSTSRSAVPNLVSLQDDIFDGLPTVLVCPFGTDLEKTLFRVEVIWNDSQFVACPELTRPIHRKALRPIGQLSETASREIMNNLLSLLAH